MAVSDRTFGVEIECTYGQKPTKKSDIYDRYQREARNAQKKRALADIGKHPDLSEWAKSIGIDGSGIEIRSPVLKGEEGLKELAAMFDFLVEKGSTVTNQDGMHVHHGAKDFAEDWKKLYHACASWGHWTPQIKLMVAARRRDASMCSDAFNSTKILAELKKTCDYDAAEADKLNKEYEAAVAAYYAGRGLFPTGARVARVPSHIGGRGALNLGNVGIGKNTIEIRLAEGMMDKDAAVAWVKFGQRFLDHAYEVGEKIEARPKTLDTLLETIQLDEEAVTVLKKKAKNKGNAEKFAAPGKIANGVAYDDEDE